MNHEKGRDYLRNKQGHVLMKSEPFYLGQTQGIKLAIVPTYGAHWSWQEQHFATMHSLSLDGTLDISGSDDHRRMTRLITCSCASYWIIQHNAPATTKNENTVIVFTYELHTYSLVYANSQSFTES